MSLNQQAERWKKNDPAQKSFYRDSDQTNVEQLVKVAVISTGG